eukprot:8767808-Lingulodinium_polyedra.AAC.1
MKDCEWVTIIAPYMDTTRGVMRLAQFFDVVKGFPTVERVTVITDGDEQAPASAAFRSLRAHAQLRG